jgi:hypothetical protein
MVLRARLGPAAFALLEVISTFVEILVLLKEIWISSPTNIVVVYLYFWDYFFGFFVSQTENAVAIASARQAAAAKLLAANKSKCTNLKEEAASLLFEENTIALFDLILHVWNSNINNPKIQLYLHFS